MTIKHSLDDTVRPPLSWALRLHLGRWPGFTVAAWGFLFAVPSFVWALGGTFGVQATVAPPLVRLAHDRVTWFLAVLWVTGFLKLFGVLVGIGLTRRRGKWTGRLMVLCGGGATVLLVWHGCQFVIHGVLVETGARAVAPDLVGLTRWYLYLWGPWFIAGGLAFAAAATRYVRRHDGRREVRLYGSAGALGALLLSLASVVTGIG
ncbi:DUF3995 domain-containing protein [Streptomyces sp. H27-H5]|uniref:DUF3995 domain-containing protein n=1 Tax=Streptomyces sp. H27-H5 TaxID=2996460 RepID=UPI00226D6C97|nr:DUF3995 domain-containing protein [Streptomyces sp. H27-H5]